MITARNVGRAIRKAALEPTYAAGVLVKRAKAFGSFMFRNGESSAPESVTLFTTHLCNLRCHMCGQWGDEGQTKLYAMDKLRQEVPIETFERMLDELAPHRPNITLFGGEPLLYRERVRLLRKIKANKMHCTIITNGTMLKDLAELLVEEQVDVISLSIDGPQDLQDKIRNMNGLFEKIMQGVEKINEVKAQRKSKLPIFNVVCTINAMNYERLREMIPVAERLQVHTLNYHHLIYTDLPTLDAHNQVFKILFNAESHDWAGFLYNSHDKINPERLEVELRECLRLGKGKPFYVTTFPNLKLEELKGYYSNPQYRSPGYTHTCISPWVTTYVYPDGEVWPCLTIGHSVGNINTQTFSEIWNGPKFLWYRKSIQENNGFPICPRCTEFYRY